MTEREKGVEAGAVGSIYQTIKGVGAVSSLNQQLANIWGYCLDHLKL